MPEGKKKQTSTSVAAKYKPHVATSEEVLDGATRLLHRLGRHLDALEVHAVGAVECRVRPADYRGPRRRRRRGASPVPDDWSAAATGVRFGRS